MDSPVIQSLEQRLVTIASGKGGVGKTWVSVTLSQALARLNKNILLFDGDLGMANVDIQLGMMPTKDVSNVISGDMTIAQATTTYSEPGNKVHFDVLAGKSGSGSLGALTREKLSKLRTGLINSAANYDNVLLDLAAGIDPSVIALSYHKGTILVVMTADPTSLTDAYAFIKVTNMRNPNAKIAIVVNNAASKKEGERTYEAVKRACEGFLKISPPLAAIIKTDNKVREAIRSQTPLFSRYPQSEAAANVMELADFVIKNS